MFLIFVMFYSFKKAKVFILPLIIIVENPAVVAWSEEHLLHKKCHLLGVYQIPLGETIPAMNMLYVYMVPTPTDVGYKYRKLKGYLCLEI